MLQQENTRDSKSPNLGQPREHGTARRHRGQQETQHGTTKDRTRDSSRQNVAGQQETRRERPRVDEWSGKAVVCLSIWSSQQLVNTNLSHSSLLLHRTFQPKSSCLSRLPANHRAANYDAEEGVTTGRGWAYRGNTEKGFVPPCGVVWSRVGGGSLYTFVTASTGAGVYRTIESATTLMERVW